MGDRLKMTKELRGAGGPTSNVGSQVPWKTLGKFADGDHQLEPLEVFVQVQPRGRSDISVRLHGIKRHLKEKNCQEKEQIWWFNLFFLRLVPGPCLDTIVQIWLLTFGDFYRKWRKKGSFLSGEPFQFMEEQFGWKSCWKSCWQPSGKHRHPQYEDDHRCARSARKMVYENAHECRGAPWGPGRFWGLRLSLPVWPCMADCLLKTLFDKNKDGFSACFFQICIMHIYIYIYTGFLRSHSLLSKIHAISWVGWCILRVIWGHEDIFIAPLTALNLCKLSAFEKRNTKSASINILELSPYVSRSQLVSHQHFFLQQKWHIYIYIYKRREPTSDRWIDTSPKQKKTVKTKKKRHPSMGVNRCSAFQVEALDSLEQGQQSDDSGTFSSNSTRRTRIWWLKNCCANCLLFTLPETNIAPENGWLEDEFPFGMVYFQGLC